MLPLPPGLQCLSAFCIYLPQPWLTSAQCPAPWHGAVHPACCLGSSDPGYKGKQQASAGFSALF